MRLEVKRLDSIFFDRRFRRGNELLTLLSLVLSPRLTERLTDPSRACPGEDPPSAPANPAAIGHLAAVDPLFVSAARLYGERVAGVVLSGYGADGAPGLRVIKSRGSLALVDDS